MLYRASLSGVWCMELLISAAKLVGLIILFAFTIPVIAKIWQLRQYILNYHRILKQRKELKNRWEALAKSSDISQEDILITSMKYDGSHMIVLIDNSDEFVFLTKDGHSTIDYLKTYPRAIQYYYDHNAIGILIYFFIHNVINRLTAGTGGTVLNQQAKENNPILNPNYHRWFGSLNRVRMEIKIDGQIVNHIYFMRFFGLKGRKIMLTTASKTTEPGKHLTSLTTLISEMRAKVRQKRNSSD